MFCEEYGFWSCSLRSFLRPPVTSSLLGPRILLTTSNLKYPHSLFLLGTVQVPALIRRNSRVGIVILLRDWHAEGNADWKSEAWTKQIDKARSVYHMLWIIYTKMQISGFKGSETCKSKTLYTKFAQNFHYSDICKCSVERFALSPPCFIVHRNKTS